MKTTFFWSTKSEHWLILLKIDEYFAINEFTKSKEKHMTRFYVTKRVEWFENLNKSRNWIILKSLSRWSNQWIIKQCTL
jgi:hypothetical protein